MYVLYTQKGNRPSPAQVKSGNHPPRATNHRYEYQERQNARRGPRPLRNHILRKCRILIRHAAPAARGRIALARPARLVRDGHADLIDQIGLNDRESSHLLTHTLCAVPFGSHGPFHAAHLAVVAAGALQSGRRRRGLDPWHDG